MAEIGTVIIGDAIKSNPKYLASMNVVWKFFDENEQESLQVFVPIVTFFTSFKAFTL